MGKNPEPGNMYCCIIPFGTPAYDASIALRYKELREPLGLAFDIDQILAEWDSCHLGIYNHRDELMGSLVLYPQTNLDIKMRQVVVCGDLQGQGIGKRLLAFSEEYAIQHGYHKMVLHARESAVPFYLSAGYKVVSDRFEEVSIPHFAMEKSLWPQ